jgi:hypothetical protein
VNLHVCLLTCIGVEEEGGGCEASYDDADPYKSFVPPDCQALNYSRHADEDLDEDLDSKSSTDSLSR